MDYDLIQAEEDAQHYELMLTILKVGQGVVERMREAGMSDDDLQFVHDLHTARILEMAQEDDDRHKVMT